MTDPSDDKDRLDDLEDIGIVAEFWEFIKDNKKFFLIPILLVLLLIGVLIVLGSTGAAPFIYTLW
jgi:hypothetical protein